MDVVAQFIADCCVVADNATVTAKDIYSAFSRWCEENGIETVPQRTLGQRLKARGYAQKRTGMARRWVGLRLAGAEVMVAAE
jgi:putative DNA primase/helicase